MNLAFAIKALGVPGGGAERVLVNIANGLAERGHKVAIISYDSPGTESFYTLDFRTKWIQLGIGTIDQPATLRETIQRIHALRRVATSVRPDFVIGFMHSMFIPLGISLMGTGIPMIASEHITPAHYGSRPLQRSLLYIVPFLARKVTVVSEQVKAEYFEVLRRRIVVVPNPIQLRIIRRANVSGRRRSRKVLLSVGRLAEQKDYTTLIDAFALVAHRQSEWDLRIVGEGELRGALQERINRLEMTGRIFLPGATKDICAEYEAAQLFVLPSLYESQGLALVEALSHGLPAVGFAACLGVNRLIRPGINGVLASGLDRVRSLAEVLEPLMADVQARERLVPSEAGLPEESGPESILDRWEQVLCQCKSADACVL